MTDRRHRRLTVPAKGRRYQMEKASRLAPLVFVLASVLLLACATTTAAPASKAGPSKVEKVQGSELAKVTLLESAAKRLDLQTALVRQESIGLRGEPGPRKMVPYSTVIYDLVGAAWVYTNPEPLTYLRAPIKIDYIDGPTAVLFDGPNVGTKIVTVGAAELYGAETGVK